MKSTKVVDLDTLREYFRLDEETGHIYWKKSYNNSVKVGQRAGYYENTGYRRLAIFGVRMPEHRVVFALHHGRWPTSVLVHINEDREDNRPSNLREGDNLL